VIGNVIGKRLRSARAPASAQAMRAVRCLIVQSDGSHKGQDGWTPNWYLRECYALQHALAQNGIQADVWGLRHDNFGRPPDFEAYDMLWCAENSELDWLPRLSRIRRPLKLQWIVDLHYSGAHFYRRVSKGCDVILHSTRRLIADYQRRLPGKPHLWFPNAVDDRYFDAERQRCEKTRDLVFVGSPHRARDALLAELERRVGLSRLFATGADMLAAVAGARIHFNCNISVDINFRTFETIGLGTCLMTNADPDLEALGFADGVNCLTYASADEAVAKLRAALADGSWERIGREGYRLSKRHTYTRRVREMLERLPHV
jgi:hypothetical protein